MRFWAAAGQGGGTEASVKENLRCGGDPPQERSCSVPLTRNGGATEMQSLIPCADGPNVAYGSRAVYHYRIAAPSWASKALRARRVAAKEREIAAVHERHAAGDDTVDPLTQRRVLPFDRGDMTRFSVEQHGGDFAPAHAFLFAIERAD